jgi:uncharacterized protein (TIGR02118 family)
MIKAVVLLRKLPHLSDEEFRRFWLEEHGPLVRSHAKARRIRKYVQVHPTGSDVLDDIVQRRGGYAVACDGIAEIYWDSLDDILAAGRSPEGQRAQAEIVEHERQFLQLPSLQIYLGREHVFVEPGLA